MYPIRPAAEVAGVRSQVQRHRPGAHGRPSGSHGGSFLLFNSLTFFVFLAVVLLVVHRLPHKAQNRFLLVASYVFYGWWDWRFLSLIALSTVIDFAVGQGLVRSDDRRRRHLMLLSLVFNLGVLATFKYFDFFVDSAADLLESVGLDANRPALSIVLPVGISFYTFQTLSYSIDVYRRTMDACDDFFDFALYVAFFPQLVAGPIERASRLLPQIMAPRTVGVDRMVEGGQLIVLGLFKKVVVADNLARVVNLVYADADPTGPEVWIATWCFAFQIYCDFSGYSAIARGVAKWLGIDLMNNFWLPYASRSPQEFWTRWHISLSSWLRDYLYIPLGGNRGAPWKVYRNLFLTMVLGGLWHGAAWNFVLWGIFQGAILIGHRLLVRARPPRRERADWLTIFFMFQVTCYGWLLFRAESLGQVGDFTAALVTDFAWTDRATGALGLLLLLAGPLTVLEWWQHRGRDPVPASPIRVPRWPESVALRGTVYAGAIGATLVLAPAGVQEFIYFQF